jgi:hypothetical protein
MRVGAGDRHATAGPTPLSLAGTHGLAVGRGAPLRTYVRDGALTSQGHLPAQYARACEQGNYALAAALAAQLKPLSLAEALNLLPLIADHEPARFESAAARWLGRWLLERPGADLGGSLLVLGALAAIRGAHRNEGLRLLRGLV